MDENKCLKEIRWKESSEMAYYYYWLIAFICNWDSAKALTLPAFEKLFITL